MERRSIVKAAAGILLVLLACMLLILPITHSGESGLAFAKSAASAKAGEKSAASAKAAEKSASSAAASKLKESADPKPANSEELEEPEEPEETPIEKAKRLILELPDDPDLILSYTDALSEAEAAYGALGRDEQADLDATDIPGRQNYTYGRHLETAQWGLLANQPVDSSVGIADGDYTYYVMQSSTMGKSTSPRKRAWSVAKLDVVDGAAWALVRCSAVSTFQSMRVGGVDYPVEYVNDVPQFYVPVVVNDTTTFTVDISDAAVSVAYQLTTKLLLQEASSEDVSKVKAEADKAIKNADKTYEEASAKAVKEAAQRLSDVASRGGVTVQELEVAMMAFNEVLDGATVLVDKRIDLGNATVHGIADCVYNGKPQTFTLAVKVGNKTLKQGTDYKVTYSDNVKVGTGTVSIAGMGNYKGSIEIAFKIKAAGEPGKPGGSSDASPSSSSAAANKGANNQKAPVVTGNKTATGAKTATAPSVSSSKSGSSASASKSSASSSKSASNASASEAETSEEEAARGGAASGSQSEEVEKAVKAAQWSEVIAIGTIIALLLAGMCVQTFRHVRAKEVS